MVLCFLGPERRINSGTSAYRAFYTPQGKPEHSIYTKKGSSNGG